MRLPPPEAIPRLLAMFAGCQALMLLFVVVTAPALAGIAGSLDGSPDLVSSASDYEPIGVRLSLGTEDDAMTVSWHTMVPANATVAYRRAGEGGHPSSIFVVVGESREFIDGGPDRRRRYVHHATLSGLEPGARYEYRVGDPSLPGGGMRPAEGRPMFAFTAKRSAAQIAAGPPLRMIATCDVGHEKSEAVLRMIAAEVQAGDGAPPIDLVIHCGDFAYDMDSENGRTGDAFLSDVEPIAAYVPYMTSAGNHERAYNFSHYARLFRMPGEGRVTDNHFYSFDIGNTHVVAYNGEAFFWKQYFDLPYLNRMYDWLEADLRAAASVERRAKVPWIVVHGHRPMYCPEPGRNGAGPGDLLMEGGRCDYEQQAARLGVPSDCPTPYGMNCKPRSRAEVLAAYEGLCPAPRQGRSAPPRVPRRSCSSAPAEPKTRFPIEALFHRYGVDLFIAGHVHDYERYFPTYGERVVNGTNVTFDRYYEPAATVHVTTGSGGNKEMLFDPEEKMPRGRCMTPESPWCAFSSGFNNTTPHPYDFTYSRITVESDDALVWEQISAVDGGVIDRFVIETKAHGPFGGRFPMTFDGGGGAVGEAAGIGHEGVPTGKIANARSFTFWPRRFGSEKKEKKATEAK